MSAGYTVRPISDRTVFTGKHRRSLFDSTWTSTEQLLLTEVRHLNGRDLVVECDVPESQIRIDGTLYARATPTSPAIRVAFESMHGPLTYATDRFAYWQHNVRAIALGLGALRRVDRYGITRRGEQYTGWRAIGPGSGSVPTGGVTATDAHDLLYQQAPEHRRANASDADLYRMARAAAHPDRRQGDRALWDQVELAGRALGLDGAR